MPTVVLGVTGSIAAYKAAEIVSGLRKRGVAVRVILTRAGAEFITPLTLETLSAAPVVADMFNRTTPWEVEHISLAKQADLFLIAPASADIIAKAAHGIADDMLSTTLLATKAPVYFAPAMNVNMYENVAVQENIALLCRRGCKMIEPESGMLACGDTGKGRLASVDEIINTVMSALAVKRDLDGKRIVVSAGPTRESIDPVRFISNRSSGRMGYAIAEAAYKRGASVTLISGPTQLDAPQGVKRVEIMSSEDMFNAVDAAFSDCDALIMAAAPADFTVEETAEHKIKKDGRDELTLKLVPTKDILAHMGGKKGNRKLIGFAAETRDIAEYAAKKLERKNLDMIFANDVSAPGVGFGYDTNALTMYSRDGSSDASGLISKAEAADWLLDKLVKIL